MYIENIECLGGPWLAQSSDHALYYTANDNLPMDGVVRTNHGGLEYYDANSQCWLPLPGNEVKLDFSSYYEDVLNWAMDKMHKEKQETELLEKYPALKTAKQNYEAIKALVENEN
jgi:hypothetical protein